MDRKNQGAGSRTQQPMHVGKSCSGWRQHVGHCCNVTCNHLWHPCVQPVGLKSNSCHLTAPGKRREEIQEVPLNSEGTGLTTTKAKNKGEKKLLQRKLRRCYEGAECRKIKRKRDEFHHALLDLKPTLCNHSKGIDLISRSASLFLFCK